MLHDVREKFAGRGFEILGIAFVEGDDKGSGGWESTPGRRISPGLRSRRASSGTASPFDAYNVGYLPFYLILDRRERSSTQR